MIPKFKVGQKVKCVKGKPTGAGWSLGKIFTIASVYDTSSGICYFPKSGSGVYEASLELNEIIDWRSEFK